MINALQEQALFVSAHANTLIIRSSIPKIFAFVKHLLIPTIACFNSRSALLPIYVFHNHHVLLLFQRACVVLLMHRLLT